jgi:hypothetical protein
VSFTRNLQRHVACPSVDVQDVHCVMRCATAPEVLSAQHHNAVFRPADGAKSWSEVGAIARSKLGFAVAVDSGGRTLALGSTTGSLWILEDAGDPFSEISSHLPEIYSVRFGFAA